MFSQRKAFPCEMEKVLEGFLILNIPVVFIKTGQQNNWLYRPFLVKNTAGLWFRKCRLLMPWFPLASHYLQTVLLNPWYAVKWWLFLANPHWLDYLLRGQTQSNVHMLAMSALTVLWHIWWDYERHIINDKQRVWDQNVHLYSSCYLFGFMPVVNGRCVNSSRFIHPLKCQRFKVFRLIMVMRK